MNETIYLSGPMTGKPDFNKLAFSMYAAAYRALGFTVISPPEMDGTDMGQPWEFYIRRDINVLLNGGVTRMYMLPDWEMSRGARLERHLAEEMGIRIFDATTNEPLDKVFVVPPKTADATHVL